MVKKIFSRKSEEETKEESSSVRMQLAPKMTVEEYISGRVALDYPKHMPTSTVIVSNTTKQSEKSKESGEIPNAPRKKNLPPKLNLSTDTYATNVYCQVGQVYHIVSKYKSMKRSEKPIIHN